MSILADPIRDSVEIPPAPPVAVPDVLLEYQKHAIELSLTSVFLMIEKSRRTGISYAFAALAVLEASPAKRPQNVFYIAYNLDMTREFIGYCAMFAKAFDQVANDNSEFLFDDGSDKGIKAFRIDFPSGKSIIALSSKPRSLRGMQGLVIIDEAAFHDEFEELLKAAMALTMWGGRVVVISTHNGADNAFATTIEDIRAGRVEGTVLRITLDDALEDGLFKRICLVTGKEWSAEAEQDWRSGLYKRYGDAADEELDVVPARGSGTYLTRATIERAMTADYPVVRLTCPNGFERLPKEERDSFIDAWLEDEVAPVLRTFDPNRRSYFGQDFARSSDLSAVAIGQLDDLANLHERLEIEMRNVPFSSQKRVLDFIVRKVPNFSSGKMDATGNGSQIAEEMQQDWGFDRIEAVKISEATYLQHMPRMKARIEDGTFMMVLSEDGIEDLRLIKLVKGVPRIIDRSTGKEDGAKGKRHGDTAIAKMFLVAAANDDAPPINFASTGKRRSSARETTTSSAGFGTVGRRRSGAYS